MNKSGNIRYKKTEEKLQNALFFLLKNNHIDDISVQMICQTAKVSRPAFYSHYDDINDMLLKIEYEKSLFISSLLTTSKRLSIDDFQKYLAFIKENKNFYIAYFRCQPVTTLSQSMMKQYLSVNPEKDTVSMKYHMYFFMAGLKAIVFQWLSKNCQESIEQMSQILMQQYLLL